MATLAPSIFCPSRANSRRIVYRSRRAWVGCSPGPSPPLMTGTCVAAANCATDPCSGWRTTIASTYPLTTRLVSAIDSPLAIDENVKPVVSQTEPPNRQNAAPKLIRVRVLGSKNRFPRTAPSRTRVTFWRRANGSRLSPTRMTSSARSRSNTSTDNRCGFPGRVRRSRRRVASAACPAAPGSAATRRATTSGILRCCPDASGSSQVSSARLLTPTRSAKALRVSARRRIASRSSTC